MMSRVPTPETALSPLDADALWGAGSAARSVTRTSKRSPRTASSISPKRCHRCCHPTCTGTSPSSGVVHHVATCYSCADSCRVTLRCPRRRHHHRRPPLVWRDGPLCCSWGIMGMLGEPFNYKGNYGGQLVQNLVPLRTMEFTQTGRSSSVMLDWHVEDGFREDRCDYVGLICLRGDPAAASQYAQAKDLQLPPALAATLREPRFHMWSAPAGRPPRRHARTAVSRCSRVRWQHRRSCTTHITSRPSTLPTPRRRPRSERCTLVWTRST